MITSVPNYTASTDAQVLAYLLEVINTRLPCDATRNDTAWATGARGMLTFGAGLEGWGGMLAKLREIGYGDVADQLTNGLDFGAPYTQAMLDQLGQVDPVVFSPARVAAMKAWGVTTRARWEDLGYTSEPTLPLLAAQRATAATDAWWQARRAVVDGQLATGAITTQQQVRDVLAEA